MTLNTFYPIRNYNRCFIPQQFFFFLLMLFALLDCRCQEIPCRLRISLLTCTPGAELYTSFGHTAVRLIDSTNDTDNVYNFGTFKPDQAGFYSSYVTGEMNYYLTVGFSRLFLEEYKNNGQGIIEQVLNLSCDEKLLIYKELVTAGVLENNHAYTYNFQKDNCTTRIRDLLFATKKGIQLKNTGRRDTQNFRSLVHYYLNNQGRSWEKLGIDVLLGSKTDNALPYYEQMFNSISFFNMIDSATTREGQPLVVEKNVLITVTKSQHRRPVIAPLTVTLLLLVIVIVSTVLVYRTKRKSFSLMVMDRLFLFGTGAIGMVILFLWMFSNQYYYGYNYNLLWANPLNLYIAFKPFNNPGIRKYVLLTLTLHLLFFAVFLFQIQQINVALLPLVIALSLRFYFIRNYT